MNKILVHIDVQPGEQVIYIMRVHVTPKPSEKVWIFTSITQI
jgi:hypothetical protein